MPELFISGGTVIGKVVFPLLLCAVFASCDDGSRHKEPPAESAEPAGHISYGGGGGQVQVGTRQSPRETIADRYEKALVSIKKRDWDGAREELIEALQRSEGHPIQKDIKEHLKIVEQGLLAQPTYEVTDLYLNADQFFKKRVSVRGTFIPGGKVGRATYYFWIKTKKRKIQARYNKLSLDDKKKILLLKNGATVLGRGMLKEPWGSNPHPYIELSYFRLERLSPEQEAAQQKRKAKEGAP